MSAERAIVLLGGGGHARVLLGILRGLDIRVHGYVAPSAEGSRLGELPWLGGDEVLAGLEGFDLVNGIGSAGSIAQRTEAYDRAISGGLRFRTVVHPSAIVEPSAELGEGAQILAGAIIAAGARIGRDAIVNTAAVVDHDSSIGAHTHVATGALLAGDVSVGNATHIGLGSRVLQGVTIGSSCVIGAGAVVLTDVTDGSTAVGVPARILNSTRND